MKQTICIGGKNDIAVNVLKYCIKQYQDDDVEIVCIPVKNDNGENSWQQSLKWYCNRNNIKLVSLEDVYGIENLLFLSTEFDRIVKTEKFMSDKLFNIHFSLLPKYKGMYPAVLPILYGEKKTGVTLHKIRDGIDTGEIIEQKEVAIEPADTSLDLYQKLITAGTDMVIKYVDSLLRNDYSCVKQEKEGSTYNPPEAINYTDLKLTLKATAFQIQNQIRAFAFRPYQLPEYRGTGIIESAITDDVSKEKPGTLISENDVSFRLSTVDYDIILYKDVLNEIFESIRSFENDRAKYLCSSLKRIDDQDEHGWTPLIVAVYANNKDMAEFLVKKGADVFAKNYNGTNLLMYAKDVYKNTGDNWMYNYIKAQGVSEKMQDYNGFDLFHYLDNDGIRVSELLENMGGGIDSKYISPFMPFGEILYAA